MTFTNNLRCVRRRSDIQWPLNGRTSPTLVRVAPTQYFPDPLNLECYNTAVHSESLSFNYYFPPAALPAPIFGQEWRDPLQSVGQDPLDPSPTAQNANPYMGVNHIQLTQVPRVSGPVDDSLTWTGAITPSPHLDYSLDHVSLLLLFCLCMLVIVCMTFLLSKLH